MELSSTVFFGCSWITSFTKVYSASASILGVLLRILSCPGLMIQYCSCSIGEVIRDQFYREYERKYVAPLLARGLLTWAGSISLNRVILGKAYTPALGLIPTWALPSDVEIVMIASRLF